jgi:hypothetical protein
MVTRKIRRSRKESGGVGGANNGAAGGNAQPDTGDVRGVEPEPAEREERSEERDELHFDPGATADDESRPNDGAEGEPRRKRKYTKRSGREKETTPNLTAELLLETHVLMAALLGCEELLLTPEEAEKLAKSIARVEALYSPKWLSEETKAWIGLATACGSIYGPRVMAVYKRTRDARPIEVVPIRVSESA